MKFLKIIIVSFIIIIHFPLICYAEKDWIFTQAQFDKSIDEINSGEKKELRLSPGTFILKSNIKAKSPLSIIGDNSSIVFNNISYSKDDSIGSTDFHYICNLTKPISHFSLFVNEEGEIVNVSETVNDQSLVNCINSKIIGEYTKKNGVGIKIPIADSLLYLKDKVNVDAYGYFDCAWSKVNFQINSISKGFFYCTTLNETNTRDFNYEIAKYKKDLRYVIFNLELKKDQIFYDHNKIYIPKSVNKIYCLDCTVFDKNEPTISTSSDIIIKGIHFKNFNGIAVDSKLNSKCLITNCRFSNTLGNALKINKKNGKNVNPAVISNCVFNYCSILNSNVILLQSDFSRGKCITVSDCYISRYPNNKVGYKNCSGAIYSSADAEIINNIIYNTPRCHIYLAKGNNIVKNNILYNTQDFNTHIQRNLSSDFGIIYCDHIFNYTKEAIFNDAHTILIEGNLIYGAHSFNNDGRGIMIDDGRGDVTCRNNLILDTDIFSIDSRDVTSFVSSSSVRNVIEGNYLGSNYRLASGKEVSEEDIAVINNNILFGVYNNIKTRVKIKKDDIVVPIQSNVICEDGKVIISKSDYRKLKKIKNWKSVKKFFISR